MRRWYRSRQRQPVSVAALAAVGLWLAQFCVVTGFSLARHYPHPLDAGLRRLAMSVFGICLFWLIGGIFKFASPRPEPRFGLAILLVTVGCAVWSLFAFAIVHAPIAGHAGAVSRIPIPRELALNAAAVAGLFAAWICLSLAIGYRRGLIEAHEGMRAVERLLKTSAPGGLWVPTRGGKTRLPLDLVEYFEAEHDYVQVHTRSGRHLLHHTLQALHDELEPWQFVRVHRSFIVNLTEVAHLRRRGRGLLELALTSGARIPVGRTYSASVRERLRTRKSMAMGSHSLEPDT